MKPLKAHDFSKAAEDDPMFKRYLKYIQASVSRSVHYKEIEYIITNPIQLEYLLGDEVELD